MASGWAVAGLELDAAVAEVGGRPPRARDQERAADARAGERVGAVYMRLISPTVRIAVERLEGAAPGRLAVEPRHEERPERRPHHGRA